jgi:[ribosomal protein S5]-alanine N-acetyltransferase
MSDFPVLETERLLLRQIVLDDAQAIYNYFSDNEVTKYYGMSSFTSLDEAENLILAFQEGFEGNQTIRWGVVRKDTNELIGTCGFHAWSKTHRRTEIGYEISRQNWRNGYVTEALHAIISYAFEHYHFVRIGAIVSPKNIGSRNLLLKIGFQEEGLLRSYLMQDGQTNDVMMHSLLKSEWNK